MAGEAWRHSRLDEAGAGTFTLAASVGAQRPYDGDIVGHCTRAATTVAIDANAATFVVTQTPSTYQRYPCPTIAAIVTCLRRWLHYWLL